MTGVRRRRFYAQPGKSPRFTRARTGLYRRLHDAFGTMAGRGEPLDVMKELLDIKEQVRGA